MRIIAHIDMDYFFAAIEERDRSELKGKPVIVGADPKIGRGVVSTANYAARGFGIYSGMPISRAYKLCPDAVFLPVNYEKYAQASDKIMSILRGYGKMEQVSIDEAFIDISYAKDWSKAEEIARRIKDDIRQKEGLPCSIGIGPNKLIAKLASDAAKPDGIKVIRPEQVKAFIEPLPVRKLWGIGPVTARQLRKIGIKRVKDIAETPIQKLAEIFGKRAHAIHQLALGIDESPVIEEWEVKSVSREHTFEKDVKNRAEIFKKIDELSADVANEVKEKGLLFRTVCIKVRYADFETHTHQSTGLPAQELEMIRQLAQQLIQPFLGKKPIRLVGVRVSNIMPDRKQKRIGEYV
ncbi:MAG: DNA polymerase IV [Candidatus Aenigmatarchaeota archaeon]